MLCVVVFADWAVKLRTGLPVAESANVRREREEAAEESGREEREAWRYNETRDGHIT